MSTIINRDINLSIDTLAFIIAVITKYHPEIGINQILLFGSFASRRDHKFSDIDIAIDAQSLIPFEVMGRIREEFAESNLPQKVDVIDLHKVSSKFRQLVLTSCIVLKKYGEERD